jgi:hypothetical protein
MAHREVKDCNDRQVCLKDFDRGVCNKEKMVFVMLLVPSFYLLVDAVSSHTHPE